MSDSKAAVGGEGGGASPNGHNIPGDDDGPRIPVIVVMLKSLHQYIDDKYRKDNKRTLDLYSQKVNSVQALANAIVSECDFRLQEIRSVLPSTDHLKSTVEADGLLTPKVRAITTTQQIALGRGIIAAGDLYTPLDTQRASFASNLDHILNAMEKFCSQDISINANDLAFKPREDCNGSDLDIAEPPIDRVKANVDAGISAGSNDVVVPPDSIADTKALAGYAAEQERLVEMHEEQKENAKKFTAVQRSAASVVSECNAIVETWEKRFRLLDDRNASLLLANENDIGGLFRLTKSGGITWKLAAGYSAFVQDKYQAWKALLIQSILAMQVEASNLQNAKVV